MKNILHNHKLTQDSAFSVIRSNVSTSSEINTSQENITVIDTKEIETHRLKKLKKAQSIR